MIGNAVHDAQTILFINYADVIILLKTIFSSKKDCYLEYFRRHGSL